MPQYTDNYGLIKPYETENYDIEVQNSNMDKIDLLIKTAEDKINVLDNELEKHKEDYVQQRQQDQLKVAKVEKELNDYKATMQQVNINQEPKQKAAGYGVISLPPNAAEGQVSVTVKGNTETDEEGNIKSTIGAVRIKSVGKNLFNKSRASKGFRLSPFDGSQQPVDFPAFCSDFIRVNSNERYYISGLLSKGYSFVAYYDKDKRFIRRDIATTSSQMLISDLQDNEKYIRITVYDTDNSPATWEDINNVLNNLQVEKGSVATAYETYRESNAYVIAKNEQGNVLELRSLPNGVKDEVRVADKKLIKRVSDKIKLWEQTWEQYGTSDNFWGVRMTTPVSNYNRTDVGSWDIENYNYQKTISVAAHSETDDYISYTTVSGHCHIKIPKSEIIGTIDNAKAKAWFEQKQATLTYQLAEPIEIPVQVSGTLTSYPNGTIYIERILPDAGVYTDKITILHQDAPIKRLDKLSKVDFMTGVETELDINQAEISEDKLSFTHPELNAGDIVFFEYEYDLESTQGETEIEYYDSRYVIKDSVTDKFYKWHIIVANGVPSIELVEV